MTTRDYEGRIAELEHALEDLIECFDPVGNSIYIDVEVTTSDGLDYAPMRVDPDIADCIASVEEILNGGAALAEEG